MPKVNFETQIIMSLTELDLPLDKEITEADVKAKYRSFSKVFHPDGNEHAAFQDGEKQKKLNAAKDFLIDNLDAVNRFIRSQNGTPNEDEQRARAEAEARARAEAEAAARARYEEEQRKKREQEARERAATSSYSGYRQNSSYSSGSYRSSASSSSSYSSSSSSDTSSSNTGASSTSSSYSSSSSSTKKGLGKGVIIFIIVFFAIGIVLGIISMARQCKPKEDDGLPEGTIMLTTKEELAAIGGENSAGNHYALKNDIDLSGEEWEPIRNFRGWFYGNGHVIKGLTITKFNTNYIGLFSDTQADVSFQGVQLVDVNIASETRSAEAVGGILGYAATNVQFKECSVEGTINCTSATAVGGIFGHAASQVFFYLTDCSFKGTVAGWNSVGGLAGKIDSKSAYSGFFEVTDSSEHKVRDNSTEGAVTGDEKVGGVIGELTGGGKFALYDNTNAAAVAGVKNVGGIAGYVKMNDAVETIENLENGGAVSGTEENVGGIFGYLNWQTTLTASTNTGALAESGASRVGGIVGYLDHTACVLSRLENKGEVHGGAYVGGIAGYGNGLIENCDNYGAVYANKPDLYDLALGGVAGMAWSVKYCTNEGAIYGEKGNGVGGIVGKHLDVDAAIEFVDCTNIGNVFAKDCNHVGGVLGALVRKQSGKLVSVKGCENRGKITAAVEKNADTYSVGGIVGCIVTVAAPGTGDCELSALTNTGEIDSPKGRKVGGIVGSSASAAADATPIAKITAARLKCTATVSGYSEVGGVFGVVGNCANLTAASSDWSFTGQLMENGTVIEGRLYA